MNKMLYYIDKLQAHPSICDFPGSHASMKHVVDMIPPGKYNKILNIGAANGLETKILKDFGYSPVGMVRGADNMAWATTHYPDIEFLDGDMHDLPFRKNTFDAIYTNQVFEHSYAPYIFLLECWCVLREGGLFYIEIPIFEERYTKNDPDSLFANHVSHHHPSLFPSSVNRQLFEKAGFEIVCEKNVSTTVVLRKLSIDALHSDVQGAVNARDRAMFGTGR